ncbi:coat protein [ssRNA phage Gephyllon.4_6]|uniref:Coat protein n=2 Tax=Leviviricetes TaxID=2842243 RepID=A0A8S5L1T0_9VIRU|nr:coat protein [ssRNA phage Gephyllon.4_6]QDH90554.1 MAG: hypothetical protein H4BulkLitter23163_000004 [Leviviridae sp.]DAD51601.1 TPA_asm: coat protein [ssRNA phage Gephyllon.4_6]
MSFTDPQTVTIAAVTTPLPRVSLGENKSEYLSADGLLRMTASHDYGKRTRRMLRIDTSKLAPDVFRPAENVDVSMAVYIVFDVPRRGGYTAAEQLGVYTGFKNQFSATSDALITKLLAGES